MTEKEVCHEKHEAISMRLDKIEKAIERIENRLPAWATVVISTLTFVLGISIGITVKVLAI